MSNPKIKCWQLTLEGSSWISDNPADFEDEIDNMNPGDEFTLSCIEMTQEEIDALPDFDGF